MAAEYVTMGRASKESDIYSFVVALEISCGRKPINSKAQEDRVNLVENGFWTFMDQESYSKQLTKLDSGFNAQEIGHLIIVGLWNAHLDSKHSSFN